MGKIIRLPILLNKKNGQINSYFKHGQLPDSIREAIKKQPSSVKKLLVTFEGWE